MKQKYLWIGAGLAGLGLAYAILRNLQDTEPHPADSAPGSASRRGFGMDKVIASAVTIHAPRDRVVMALTADAELAGAMAGQPGIAVTLIDHSDAKDVLSWHTEDGDLVKLRVRSVRGGTFTAVTGILALEGRRLGASVATLFGHSPRKALRHALTETRMRIETGEVAVAGTLQAARKG